MDYSKELVAQYGNIIVDPNTAANLRGSGAYNPPPNYEQTTDRGKAYVNALNLYERTNPKTSEPQNMPIYEDQLKQWHNQSPQKYVVCSTSMHPQKFDSWNRTQFGESEYQHWARNSVQQDPNSLLNFFFATENIDYIQNRIIAEVKRIKKIVSKWKT